MRLLSCLEEVLLEESRGQGGRVALGPAGRLPCILVLTGEAGRMWLPPCPSQGFGGGETGSCLHRLASPQVAAELGELCRSQVVPWHSVGSLWADPGWPGD